MRFTTLEAMLRDSISASRFRATLIGLFAALALCLAMAGVYGVMVYEVSQRSGEIGVRVALGGEPKNILRLVLARLGADARRPRCRESRSALRNFLGGVNLERRETGRFELKQLTSHLPCWSR
jgi:hypothetical protein